MTITPSTIALAAVITSGLVGFVTPVMSAWVTMQGKKHDRLMAVDGRVFGERSRVYLNLSIWALTVRRLLANHPTEEIAVADLPDDDTFAELQIYGSSEVRDKVDELIELLPHALSRQVTRAERLAEVPGTGFRRKVERLLASGDDYRSTAIDAINSLMSEMRKELTEEELRKELRPSSDGGLRSSW